MYYIYHEQCLRFSEEYVCNFSHIDGKKLLQHISVTAAPYLSNLRCKGVVICNDLGRLVVEFYRSVYAVKCVRARLVSDSVM